MSSNNTNTNNNNIHNVILKPLVGGGYNYNEWVPYITIILKAERVWRDVMKPQIELDENDEYIIPLAADGSEMSIADYVKILGTSTKLLDEHRDRLFKAQRIIGERIDPSLVHNIKFVGGASIWQQIKQLCNESSKADITRIINDLCKFRMLETDTIAQHEQEFNKLLSDALNAGIDVYV